MPGPKAALTARELAIMKIVWERDGATVREVHDALQRRRPVAYTTVMTLMNILQTKGYLRRRRSEDRAYFYSPTRPRQQVLRALVADFIDRVFDGAAQPLRVHLMRDERLTDEERRELKRMIDAVED
jgi:predicted transcriptional regulator